MALRWISEAGLKERFYYAQIIVMLPLSIEAKYSVTSIEMTVSYNRYEIKAIIK